MKLFNLMANELEFLKQGLSKNSPLNRDFNASISGCQVCQTVCATGCGANCKGQNSSN